MKQSLSATEFSTVFRTGTTSFAHPLKLVASVHPSCTGVAIVKTAFAVPKRMVKKAALRNRIKRQMRAAFRNQENVLRGTFFAQAKIYNLIFIYSDSKLETSVALLEAAICKNVKTLAENIK